MSFRYYPMYVKGNPQLRIYLPNFWMKLLKPKEGDPKNVVTFRVPVQMNDFDVRNYLEKIYKLPVVSVQSTVRWGDRKRAIGKNYLVKEDDYRIAYVSLPKDKEFNWPNLFPEKKIVEEDAEFVNYKKQMEKEANKIRRKNWDRHQAPTWFSF
ncbi:39S ribosomal protein L23, mitochondrial-like [Panonychus citri]|uniref:39S ribosomal protein L23, mitochondrial-like n=1 Tax=Panonychus citri TaxID=50023 RepID=UPI0023077D20|nr:39S ribosomal protein L23, mitochondrial-like [Panonychus citri]